MRSGKELTLLTSLALGDRTWHAGPLQQNTTIFQKEGMVRSWGVKRDLEGNLCCQISWNFHGQRQII